MKQIIFFSLLGIGISACKKEETTTTLPNSQKDDHQTTETHYVDANGIRYAYRTLGEKKAIPLVMISSLGSSMDDWDPAITNGLAQNHYVVLFDIQGVGLSGGKTSTTIETMANGTVDFIRALGFDQVDLLGFSMGSFISQQIALTQPTLVSSLILTGTGPKGAIGLANLPNLLAASANLSPEESFLRFGFTNSDESIEAGKKAYARIHQRTVNRDLPPSEESVAAQVQAVLRWAQTAPEALNELASIPIPVLIAQGEADIPVPVENAVNMSKYIPNAHLVTYPDAGHAAIFQYPDKFVQAANQFLKDR